MATKSTKKKTSTAVESVAEVELDTEAEAAVEVEEAAPKAEVKEVKQPVKKEVKKFDDADLIPCLCAFPGSVGLTGKRSRNKYLWEDMGVVEYVEYQDLRSEVLNKKSAYIYKPLIIIEDQDFLEQNPSLTKMYQDIYAPEEIVSKIRKSTPEELRKFVSALPVGVKDNVKSIAATMIKDGDLDSLKKIKVLDDIFETDLNMYSQFFVNEE